MACTLASSATAVWSPLRTVATTCGSMLSAATCLRGDGNTRARAIPRVSVGPGALQCDRAATHRSSLKAARCALHRWPRTTWSISTAGGVSGSSAAVGVVGATGEAAAAGTGTAYHRRVRTAATNWSTPARTMRSKTEKMARSNGATSRPARSEGERARARERRRCLPRKQGHPKAGPSGVPRKSTPTRPSDRPKYMLCDSSVAMLAPSVSCASDLEPRCAQPDRHGHQYHAARRRSARCQSVPLQRRNELAHMHGHPALQDAAIVAGLRARRRQRKLTARERSKRILLPASKQGAAPDLWEAGAVLGGDVKELIAARVDVALGLHMRAVARPTQHPRVRQAADSARRTAAEPTYKSERVGGRQRGELRLQVDVARLQERQAQLLVRQQVDAAQKADRAQARRQLCTFRRAGDPSVGSG